MRERGGGGGRESERGTEEERVNEGGREYNNIHVNVRYGYLGECKFELL